MMASTICSHCRLALRRTIRASRSTRQQIATQSTRTATAAPATLNRPSRTPSQPADDADGPDLASLLSQPTWSVRSLLPPSTPSPTPTSTASEPEAITPKTLHHLLRLSALPLPKTSEEETQMLATLSSQLHFVRAIQRVDTLGVAPLRVIRDETAAGVREEQTIGLAELRDALAAEDVVGHARRPRRRRRQGQTPSQAKSLQGQGQGQQQHSDTRISGMEVGEEEEEAAAAGRDGTRDHATKELKHSHNEEEDWDVLGGASETVGGRYFVVRSNGTG
ncbi:hypothetical protein F4777DRAFT_572950 [Nemania sp. FL0916]|nr:hypothetical protein F4777DRAFT_572950 [Nemania sp. FL0916]